MNTPYTAVGGNERTDYVLNQLTRAFAGRGLGAALPEREDVRPTQAQTAYPASGMPTVAYSASAPLTLAEFERQYRSHSDYAIARGGIAAVRATARREAPRTPETPSRPARQPMQAVPTPRPMPNRQTVRPAATPRPMPTAPEARRTVRTAARPQAKSPATLPVRTELRRAVVQSRDAMSKVQTTTLVRNFRHLPVATLMTIIACAVSLMLIVGSSVLFTRTSHDYIDLQHEVSDLAEKESKLSIELEMKNDLRTIEDIAMNKLGMVKKDLITRQYIRLNDEDKVERYGEAETNVGLATLLTAIRGEN